jgi:two-component system response regulator AtoC
MTAIRYHLVIVDDEPTIRDGITLALGDDYQVTAFGNAEDALAALPHSPPDLILLDIGLPGMNGIEALGRIKASNPHILVVMITAFEDIDAVIRAMKLGAHDYVIKPLKMDQLELTIANALETIRLRKEVQTLQAQSLKENMPLFIGESNAIQSVMDLVQRVSRSADTPVLIEGETGTGKELLASAIHYHSPVFKGPFVAVNCAAIPRELVESELFGYRGGAFSGAREAGKTGLVETAHNGTLFLDEIGDLSPEAQAKLLRFLESGEFYRVGETKPQHVAVRIVTATNRDLSKMMADGRFRDDLYFRLGVIKIKVPSLNERPEDLLPLAKYYLEHFNAKFGTRFKGLSAEARQALGNHHWTGNVRELKNLIERAVLTGRHAELTPHDLGLAPNRATGCDPDAWFQNLPTLPTEGIDLTHTLEQIEKHFIGQALQRSSGNESQAARLLGLNHHTFRYRHRKLSS